LPPHKSPAQIRPKLCHVALLLTGFVGLALMVRPTHALQAAGAFDSKGNAIAGVQQFAEQIKGNVVWAISVLSGVGIALVGGMFIMGHSRAQDYAIKAFWGFLIVAGGSGLVA